MSGVTVNQGKNLIGNRVYNVSDLVVGLFTNSSGLSVTSVWDNITQPSPTNGYAEVTITSGSFTVSSTGDITYATPVVFTASGGDFGPVYGAYIRTTDATPILLHFEVDASYAPMTVLNGQTYNISLANLVT